MKIDDYKKILEDHDVDAEQYNHYLDAQKKELELKGYSNSWFGKPQKIGIMVSLMAILIPASLSFWFRYLDHQQVTKEVTESRKKLIVLQDSILDQNEQITLLHKQWEQEQVEHQALMAQMLQEKGQLEEAKQSAFQIAKELSRFSESTSEANMAFALNNWPQAVEYFSKAIRSNPSCAVCYEQRGFAYFKMGEAGTKGAQVEAAKDLTLAIRLDPNRPSSHYFLGRININIGQWDKAIKDFSNAVGQGPFLKDAFARRAYCFEKVGNLKAAIQDLATYCKIEPDPKEKGIKQSHLNRLQAQLKQQGME